MKKRVLLIVSIFILTLLGFANANINVYAEPSNVSNTVSYISRYWDDETNEVKIIEKNCDNFNEVRSVSINWLDGWYVVTNDVTINERIIATGTINLIICDDKTLTAKRGIHLGKDSTLNIYSQTNDTGTGVFTGISGTAGIGGSKLDIDGGNINIFGGIINATGGQFGAGIGGGNKGASGNVAVYGGTITAKGGSGASGIGSGNGGIGGTTIINDGVVSTTGGYPGVGISGNLIVAENLTVLGNNDDTPSYQYDIQNDYALTRWKYMDIKYVHKHKWKYVASGETITATCDTNDCPETWGLTLTIIGGDSWYNSQYGGQANNPYIDLNINKAAFGTPTISYYKDGVKVDRCVDAGTYEARVTVGGVTATKQITIHKRTALVYAIKEVENLKYDGSSHELIEYGLNIGGEIRYKLEGGEYSTDIPTAVDAGEYVVYYKAFGNSNYEDSEEKFLNITIEKADSYTITEPTAISNLVYDGSSQALITAGVASGGELQYKLEGGEYSTDIPTAIDAGEYNVYYKVIGDSNHNDVEENVVVVNIKKADSSITTAPTAISNLIYNGSNQELINPGIASGEILYSLGNVFLSSIPSAADAGSYVVYYIVDGDLNHEIGEINLINVTIKKADISMATEPTAISNLIYDGSSQALITAGVASGGELQYKLEGGEYSTDIPTAVDAGNYNVYYKVIGDSNYNDVEENVVAVNIKKADISMATSPTAISNLVYDGTDKKLINKGEASGGELQYKLEGGEYSTDIPTAIDAGNYNVYYKVIGDSNYNDVEENVVVVNIKKAGSSITTDPTAISNLVYDGSSQALITAGVASGGELQYKLEGGGYSSSIPSAIDAGNYSVLYKVFGTLNTDDSIEYGIHITINKATPTGYEKPSDLNAVYRDTLSSITLPSNWAWKNATELVGNVGNQEHIAIYTPTDPNYKAVEETLVVSVSTANPTGYEKPDYLEAIYGQTLANINLPTNWLWKNATELVGNVGNQEHIAIYTPTDSNYKAVEETLVVSVSTANPTGYDIPDNLEAIYGETLSNITLPSNWSWKNPDELVGNVGNRTHTAIYTPTDPNYHSTSDELTIKVNQAIPTGYEKPSDLNAVYGDTLSSIALPSNWAWKNDTELVGNVGNQEHIAIYTPTDSNYKAVEETLNVTVTAATPTGYEKPSDLNAVYGDTLSSIALPSNWAWKNATELVGDVGEQEHIAIYTPDNPEYETVEDKLIVTVARAMPEKPDNLEAIYGQTLENVILPEGWSWHTPLDLVGEVGTQEHTAIYISSNKNYSSTVEDLQIKVNQATPTGYDIPDNLEAIYGETLSNITLPSNWSWKNSDELVGEVGNQEHIAIYTPTDSNYKAVEEMLVVSVLSSIPTDYKKPNDLAAFYGDKLSSITLPECWSWKNPDELVGNVGNQEHIAIYTPTDSKYESVEEVLIVSVMSASPEDYEKPDNLEAIYGQKLSNIVLPEGWSWEKPDDLVGNVGNRTHTAIYTPTDPNYHSTSDELTIKVNQATPTDFEKPNDIEVAYGDKLSSITLPEGWSWKNPDELVGDDVNQEYIAIYTPADKNYKAVEILLTISVKGAEKGSNNGLPVGAIVGISIGSTVIASVGVFSLIWFVIKKKSWADLLAIFKKK